MFVVAVLSAALLLSAETVPAAEPAPAAVPSKTAEKPADARKLKCEKMVQLGSRMPVRVCRTPDQIKQSQADARDTTVDFQKINPEAIH